MTSPYGTDPWRPPPAGGPPPAATPAPQWSGQPVAWPPYVPQPTDGNAVAACVLGILSVLSLPIAAAVVSGNRPAFLVAALLPAGAALNGHLARRRLRTSGRTGSGLATTGVACGWLVLAILAFVLVAQPDGPQVSRVQPGHIDLDSDSRPPWIPGPPTQDDPTARGIMTGTVRGGDGELVEGAQVTVRRGKRGDVSDHPPCPIVARTATGADGQWFLPLCQLGEGLGWTLEITKGRRVVKTSTLYVHSGRTTTYDLRLG